MKIITGILILVSAFLPARAVESYVSGSFTYNTSVPSDGSNPSGSVSGWGSGWGTDSGGTIQTGWSYVGVISGVASGTYLGNGWVLTAGHVGSGTFVLNGVTYSPVAGSDESITNTGSSPTTYADLDLFQIAAPDGGSLPDLPSLTIATTPPLTSVVMIGEGGGKSWGHDHVTGINQEVSVDGYSYVSTDFSALFSSSGHSDTAELVSGDSGGGDFIYDSSKGIWELTGINEAIGTTTSPDTTTSYMVELSAYATQIDAIVAPEPGAGVLALIGCLSLFAYGFFFRNRIQRCRCTVS